MSHTDVLIAGAGPTGLVLALCLHKQGVSFRIVDHAEGPSKNSRALAVHARILELYCQIDIADEVAAAGYPLPATNIWVDGKHYAHIGLTEFGESLTPYPYILMLSQEDHERILENRLNSLGIHVERRTKLQGYVDHGSKITATLLQETDGSEVTCEASWIVGCDGAHSTVRHGIGAKYEGDTYVPLFYIADIEAEDSDSPIFNGEGHLRMVGDKFNMILPFVKGKRIRLIGTTIPENYDNQTSDKSSSHPKITFEDVLPEIRAVTGLEIKKLNWFSTYRSHHRVADKYRKNRAFIVGDAAHIHSPVGGQGMNTGIMDAVNLAWKLSTVIKNPEMSKVSKVELLDSYEAERRAFALDVVGATDQGFTVLTASGIWPHILRAWLIPYCVPLLTKLDSVKQEIFRRGSQLVCTYRGGYLSQAVMGSGAVHPGDRLPWAKTESSDNYCTLAAPKITWQIHVYGEQRPQLEEWCSGKDVQLTVFEWDPHHGKVGFKKNTAYLLRPDQYIAGIFEGDSIESMLTEYLEHRGLPL